MTRSEHNCRRKRRYLSEQEAANGADAHSTRKVKLRCYRCPHCTFWHLTKQRGPEPVDAASDGDDRRLTVLRDVSSKLDVIELEPGVYLMRARNGRWSNDQAQRTNWPNRVI